MRFDLNREKEVSQEEPTVLVPSGLSALLNQKGKAIPAQQSGLPIRVYLPNRSPPSVPLLFLLILILS
jgi:hypothetical protein